MSLMGCCDPDLQSECLESVPRRFWHILEYNQLQLQLQESHQILLSGKSAIEPAQAHPGIPDRA